MWSLDRMPHLLLLPLTYKRITKNNWSRFFFFKRTTFSKTISSERHYTARQEHLRPEPVLQHAQKRRNGGSNGDSKWPEQIRKLDPQSTTYLAKLECIAVFITGVSFVNSMHEMPFKEVVSLKQTNLPTTNRQFFLSIMHFLMPICNRLLFP